VWDTARGSEIVRLRGHEGWAWAAAFGPDGARIATASSERIARVWDAASGAEIVCLRGHDDLVRTAAFSPDGARIATASDDRTARVWDAASGAEIARLRGHTGLVRTAAFSPDGARIVTASDDGTARVWNVTCTAALAGRPALVLAASLSFGRGQCTGAEQVDLLMQAAPKDLFAAIVAKLTDDERADIERRSEALARLGHPTLMVGRGEHNGSNV
jgi:hypothetical protein